MPIVIFLIGIAVKRRHHSQVRMHPWTMFFNGDCASNNRTAATLQPQTIAQGCFYPAQARHGARRFFKMSRSMRSRSFSRCKRAISAAWSADGSVACVVGRRAAAVGSSPTLLHSAPQH
jgi:hypothetical protein